MKPIQDAYIVAATRTPIGRSHKGSFKHLRPDDLLAIALRSALETLPDARLKDTIESRLLPQALPGARLREIEVKNLGDLDAPLVLAMKIEQSSFARPRGTQLVIAPPFGLNLGNLATRRLTRPGSPSNARSEVTNNGAPGVCRSRCTLRAQRPANIAGGRVRP